MDRISLGKLVDQMKAQTPALGIMLLHERADSKTYLIDCQCTDPDDSITLTIESQEWGDVVVNTCVTVKSPHWIDRFGYNRAPWGEISWYNYINCSIRQFLNSLTHRLIVTRDVWIHGYVKYESSTLMSQQQAFNYTATINKAIDDIEEFARLSREKELADLQK